jgi:hypothetical protein
MTYEPVDIVERLDEGRVRALVAKDYDAAAVIFGALEAVVIWRTNLVVELERLEDTARGLPTRSGLGKMYAYRHAARLVRGES